MLAISQPTYLPWCGYFDLIDRSETFVFLDDVQFNRRSWQQKNRIVQKEDYLTLSVPVKKKGLRQQSLNKVEFFDEKFKDTHLKSIKHSYSKSRFFKDYFNELEKIYFNKNNSKYLVNLNISIINWICTVLEIKKKFVLSSDMRVTGNKSQKIINICKKLNKNIYMTNPGALEYITKDKDLFLENGIKVFIQEYEQHDYIKKERKFLNQASIIDLIFNNGPDSLNIIRKSRKKERTL
jgi:hypothetical protein